MKKVNKFFGLMLIAGCSMGLATKVNAAAGVCEAANADGFAACVRSNSEHVINVSGTYTVSDDIEVSDKRIVLDNNAKLTISGKLTVKDFEVKSYETAARDRANILLQTGSQLVVQGELAVIKNLDDDVLKAGGSNIVGIRSVGYGSGSAFNDNGVLVDGGKLTVSGFENAGMLISKLEAKGNAIVELSNNGTGARPEVTTIEANAVVNAHDNYYHGFTVSTLTVEGTLSATGNGYNGITVAKSDNVSSPKATVKGNGKVEATDNHTNENATSAADLVLTVGDNAEMELQGNAALTAGSVVGAANKLTTDGNGGVTLDVEDATSGVLTAPSKAKGIIRVGNWVHVYTLNGDTVAIGMEDSLGDGVVGVVNHTDKDIKVVTEDSIIEQVVTAGQSEVFKLVKITAKVDGKVVDGEVVVFEGQEFSKLSETGKNKLDAMLAKPDMHINNYVATAGQALTNSYTFDNDTVLTATYYIVLTIGNQEFWVNPNTKLSDLSNADKAKLEAIKTSSTKKFMYFAYEDGTAISETDTIFTKDTKILVLYEGDAAPVVPDTPEDPDEPSKPDDGTTTTPGEEEKPPFSSGDDDATENPATGDNVMGSIAMGVAGLVGIVGSAVVFDKKTNYNN